jgi:beta-glucosidase
MAILTFDDARRAVQSGTALEDAARQLVAAMTPEERLWCLDGDEPTWGGLRFLFDRGYNKAPFPAAQVERIGLPGMSFADGPRGAVIGNATCFPVPMARGATWDPELEERIGQAIGQELRALGATLSGAVCVNLLRHPAWGRGQETYGEDPHHVGELGAAFTRGLQRHVMACVKHFAANSMENARFSVNIDIDDVALHEIYLPHFRRVVDEGVAAVMSAYNSLNGEWCGQNVELLTNILRGEWAFPGFVISDFIFGVRDAARSLAAGLDIEMPFRMVRAQHLPEALERGEARWADVDAAVTRIVATLLRFDRVLSQVPDPRVVGSAEHRALAREAAARSVVLLRNEMVGGTPVLPLPGGSALALIGQLGDSINLGDGGSSDVWDLDCHTILEGLRAAAGTVAYDDGADPTRAATVAALADAAIVVVGYTYRDEGEQIGDGGASLVQLFPPSDEPEVLQRFEAMIDALPPTITPEHVLERPKYGVGDRLTLRLRDEDLALVRAIAAANPRTIVAIQSGSAVLMSEWVDAVPAVVQAWYGGSQAGPGLADVLFGVANPSARLPFSIPVDEGDLPPFDPNATSFRYDRWHGWWHLSRTHRTPTFPFGFGLAYTTFELDQVEINVSDREIVVGGAVVNTGHRDGADVVQVYVHLPDPDVPARLVGFARVEIPAAGAVSFQVRIPRDRLATRDPQARAWRAAAGRHRIDVARSAADPDRISCDIDL